MLRLASDLVVVVVVVVVVACCHLLAARTWWCLRQVAAELGCVRSMCAKPHFAWARLSIACVAYFY
jgi:hypothetical protein